MKLSHTEIERCIEFEENKINVLVIENAAFFTEIINELNNQIKKIEGRFVLSRNLKEIKIDRKCELVIDFFNLTFNSSKIKKELYNRLESVSVNEKNYLESNEIKNRIIKFCYEIEDEIDFDLDINEEFTFKDIFKAIKLKINDENFSFSENLIEYMNIFEKFIGIKLFIFVNLKNFLSEKDLELFYQFIFYNKYKVLLIESNDSKKLDQEKKIIIDKDLCEIWYN